MRNMLLIVFFITLLGCSSQSYRNTNEGHYSGSIDVRWIENDYFLFIPNETDPFTFTRANGQLIKPGIMYTDGGSIPKFLWGINGFSPWGYAPAYIIHDWIFEAKHCEIKPYNQYEFSDSVDVMAESLKSVMEQNNKVKNYVVFNSVITGIDTWIAKKLWSQGKCKHQNSIRKLETGRYDGELIMTIQY